MSGTTPAPYVSFAEVWTVAEWNAFFASLGARADAAIGVKPAPIGLAIPGIPRSGQPFHISVPFACTIAPMLAGSTVYAETVATANATFIINRISAGNVVSTLGTITFTNAGNFSAIMAGMGGALAVGDALQVICPSAQDATLADLGITILATRT